ncbi:MAG TPA: class I SAM-dependent methyltransferase [Salegentibacter sp.]|uniref:class I SAM-dependent methyltransferase n=1 Tax=Salegentibacter sp. TaxID=1903072 RepID=UPI002F930DEF
MMANTEVFERNVAEYEAWFDRFPAIFDSEILAIRRHFQELPENILGIEVGMGSGRYAQALGIKEGVEPATSMRNLALDKALEVVKATAEHLPYKDLHFDFVLFVTICHLDSFPKALKEANRVIKRGGHVIIGFIDKGSKIGIQYEEKKGRSTFYKNARFYLTSEVEDLLKASGFKNPVFSQCLFDDLENIQKTEEPKEGTGEGSFVVVRATKK